MRKYAFLFVLFLIIGYSKSFAGVSYVYKSKQNWILNTAPTNLNKLNATNIQKNSVNCCKINFPLCKKRKKGTHAKQLFFCFINHSITRIRNFDDKSISKTSKFNCSFTFPGNLKRGPPAFIYIS